MNHIYPFWSFSKAKTENFVFFGILAKNTIDFVKFLEIVLSLDFRNYFLLLMILSNRLAIWDKNTYENFRLPSAQFWSTSHMNLYRVLRQVDNFWWGLRNCPLFGGGILFGAGGSIPSNCVIDVSVFGEGHYLWRIWLRAWGWGGWGFDSIYSIIMELWNYVILESFKGFYGF